MGRARRDGGAFIVMMVGYTRAGNRLTLDGIAVVGYANRLLVVLYCVWVMAVAWQAIRLCAQKPDACCRHQISSRVYDKRPSEHEQWLIVHIRRSGRDPSTLAAGGALATVVVSIQDNGPAMSL